MKKLSVHHVHHVHKSLSCHKAIVMIVMKAIVMITDIYIYNIYIYNIYLIVK